MTAPDRLYEVKRVLRAALPVETDPALIHRAACAVVPLLEPTPPPSKPAASLVTTEDIAAFIDTQFPRDAVCPRCARIKETP